MKINTYGELSDGALVALCLSGDNGGFEELVRRYHGPVFSLAYHMTGSRADADDLTQGAFLRAYSQLAKFDMDRSFKNWIVTICANQTKNVFRKRTRRRETEQSYVELCELNRGGTTRSQDGEAVMLALASLSPKLRAPLVLKHIEGYAYEEIASLLNIGVSAAKMRVKRARDELVALLGSGGNTESS